MKLLTRYTVVEFLKVFLVAMAGMTIFMFFVVGGREAVRQGLGPEPILRIMPYILPESMRFSVPAAALLASCIVFGRMSGDNEVTAIKSMGISPLALMTPAFIVAFLISVFSVWMNDLAVSWGLPGQKQTVIESLEDIVYGMLRTQRSYSNDDFSISVARVEERKLIMPTLIFHSQDEGGRVTVTAAEAELRHNREENTMSVFLVDGSAEGPDGYEGAFSGRYERVIPLADERDRNTVRPSDYAMHELAYRRSTEKQNIQRQEQNLAASAGYRMLTGELAALSSPDWQEKVKQLRSSRYRLNRLKLEPWRRWANGFSCFFFVMVGVPMSVTRRNSDFVTSFFLSFLPILLVYYPVMTYGVEQAKAGSMPAYAVWLGNLACVLWGGWLIQRVVRF